MSPVEVHNIFKNNIRISTTFTCILLYSFCNMIITHAYKNNILRAHGMWQNQGTGYYNSFKNSKSVGMLFSGIFCYKAIVMFTQVCMHKITKQIFKGHITGIIRVLKRKLKLLTFSWKWKIRLKKFSVKP